MPCESLDRFRETKTYLRACNGCHVSTFPGRGLTNILITLPLGRTIIVKPNWTYLYCLVKNLKSKKLSGTKTEQKEKEYSALNIHIATPKMNNRNLTTCYIDTYTNQSLYTNLVNNFARFRVSVYVSST